MSVVEVRAFGVAGCKDLLTPQRGVQRQKPTSEMTIAELREQLDRLEAGLPIGGDEVTAAEQYDSGRAQAIERLRVLANSRNNADPDDDHELQSLGMSTWGPGKR